MNFHDVSCGLGVDSVFLVAVAKTVAETVVYVHPFPGANALQGLADRQARI